MDQSSFGDLLREVGRVVSGDCGRESTTWEGIALFWRVLWVLCVVHISLAIARYVVRPKVR